MKLLFLSLYFFSFLSLADTPEHEALLQYVSNSNQFGLELKEHLSHEKNLFYSPYSISTAMAFAALGAKGETQKEMLKTLHLDLSFTESQLGFKELQNRINFDPKEERGYQLHTANAMWLQKELPFVAAFLEIGTKTFQAELKNVDFIHKTENTRREINKWVEDKTEKKIKDLIAKGLLTKDHRLVLTNAIYFKGEWQNPFEKSLTKKEKFYLSPKEIVQTEMMHVTSSFDYVKTDGVSLIELPYKRSSLSMLILVPDEISGLKSLEQRLNPENLNKWATRYAYKKINLSLPKFKTLNEFRLENALISMGMGLAFSPAADFSAITEASKISIGTVAHKAFIQVDEKGTEAAAATGVMYKLSAAAPEEKPIEFKVDRPFIYLIRDSDSKAILFLGRIFNPLKRD